MQISLWISASFSTFYRFPLNHFPVPLRHRPRHRIIRDRSRGGFHMRHDHGQMSFTGFRQMDASSLPIGCCVSSCSEPAHHRESRCNGRQEEDSQKNATPRYRRSADNFGPTPVGALPPLEHEEPTGEHLEQREHRGVAFLALLSDRANTRRFVSPTGRRESSRRRTIEFDPVWRTMGA